MAGLFRPRSMSRLDQILGKSCLSKWTISRHGKLDFKSKTVSAAYCLSQKRCESTTPFPEFPDLKTHEELYKYSLDHSETFWGTLARSRLTWSKDFTTVTDSSFEAKKFGWFQGGELNASGKLGCI